MFNETILQIDFIKISGFDFATKNMHIVSHIAPIMNLVQLLFSGWKPN